MIFFVLVLVAAALLFVWVERRRLPMDQVARADAPGRFAALDTGMTHYRWDGPSRGPVIVCVHGLTSASYIFDAVARGLTTMGFRVLRYDLLGRGYSDRPENRHGRGLYLRQLRELLQDQEVESGFLLMGYSMGGSIATAFTAEEPHRVDRLILLAPAGLGHTPGMMARICMKVPLLGDLLMRVFGGMQLRRGIRRANRAPGEIAHLTEKQIDETRYRGFLDAVLSSLRNILSDDFGGAHKRIGAAGIPVLAVWGTRDASIPLSAMGRLAKINRAARQHEIPDATHAFPHTHPKEVHAAIQDFLRSH